MHKGLCHLLSLKWIETGGYQLRVQMGSIIKGVVMSSVPICKGIKMVLLTLQG